MRWRCRTIRYEACFDTYVEETASFTRLWEQNAACCSFFFFPSQPKRLPYGVIKNVRMLLFECLCCLPLIITRKWTPGTSARCTEGWPGSAAVCWLAALRAASPLHQGCFSGGKMKSCLRRCLLPRESKGLCWHHSTFRLPYIKLQKTCSQVLLWKSSNKYPPAWYHLIIMCQHLPKWKAFQAEDMSHTFLSTLLWKGGGKTTALGSPSFSIWKYQLSWMPQLAFTCCNSIWGSLEFCYFQQFFVKNKTKKNCLVVLFQLTRSHHRWEKLIKSLAAEFHHPTGSSNVERAEWVHTSLDEKEGLGSLIRGFMYI